MLVQDFAHYVTNDMQDLMISQRILNGERELFALLLKPYNGELYVAAKAIVKDQCDIEKAMMSSYGAAFERLYCFDGERSFKVWLLSVSIAEMCKVAAERDESADESQLRIARLVTALYTDAEISKRQIAECFPDIDVKQHLINVKKPASKSSHELYNFDYLVEKFMRELLVSLNAASPAYCDLADPVATVAGAGRATTLRPLEAK